MCLYIYVYIYVCVHNRYLKVLKGYVIDNDERSRTIHGHHILLQI